MKPWEQQEGESSQAFRAARIYFEMGPARTLLGVTRAIDNTEVAHEGPKKAPSGPSGTVKRWAKQWNWRERAQAFDQNLTAVADQARESEVANQAVVLEQRRAKIAETGWALSQAGLVRVAEMLRHPLTDTTTETTTSEDGRTVIHRTTVQAARWRFRDVATLLRAFDDLQRLVVGMPNRIAVPMLPRAATESPVDQTEADEANARIPEDLTAEDFWDRATYKALAHEGRLDDLPEDD